VELRNDWERFEAAGLAIVAIGQGSAARSKEFRAQMELPFPLLADPRRLAFGAYGLLQMSVREEANLASLRNVVQATIRYGGAASTDQDMRQLGGVFVVGTDGIVRYIHRARRASDHPPHDALIAAIR
jgi:alkyl hydroperoxide reductase subunit AhpC